MMQTKFTHLRFGYVFYFLPAENGDALSCPDDIIENARISPLILGNGGYPLMKRLVTSYRFSPNHTVTEKKSHLSAHLEF